MLNFRKLLTLIQSYKIIDIESYRLIVRADADESILERFNWPNK